MENLKEIENAPGLYKIEKVKTLYYLGYSEDYVYMINLDNGNYKSRRIVNE